MRKLFYLSLIIVGMCWSLPASATGCTNTAYGSTMTCVKATAIQTSGAACGLASNVISVTNSGDRIVLYTDTGDANNTAVTSSPSATWSNVGNLSSTAWNTGNNSHTAIWSAIAPSTGSMSITVTCAGNTTGWEYSLVELHSSVGTVGVDCTSNWQIGASNGTNPSTSCTSSHPNDLAMSFVDWNNGATAGSGWTIITDTAENIMEVKSVPTAGTVNGTWTLGPDFFISGTAAFNDGGPADFYYGATSAGGNNGSSCANQYAYTDATNGINTAGKWVSGNTLHLCGTFTLSSNTTMITAQASGTSGSPITIKFETGADLKSPFWPSATGAINGNSKSFLVVDGGTNGIIENTANGTGLANQVNSTGIQFNGSHDSEIKNLTIKNLYVHTSSSDVTVDAQQVNCVQFQGSNILIHDSTFTDTGWCLYQNYTNDSGVQIYNNTLTNYAHGVICAGANFTQSDIKIYNNHFGSMANWGTGATDQYHLAGIHCYNGSGGKIQNAYIYNNLFDGNMGTCCITGQIFLEGGTGAGSTPWTDTTGTAYLWNNIFIANLDVSNGLVTVSVGTGHILYNNTMIGPNGGNNGVCYDFATAPKNIIFENNIVEGCSQLIRAVDSTTTLTAIDYNSYGNASGGNPIWQFPTFSSSTLAAWKSACSCDAHSTASLAGALPNLNSSTGKTSAGFVGITNGLNLTSSASGNLSSLASDTSAGGAHVPVVRPSLSAWDTGAYQFQSAASPVSGGLGYKISGGTVH